MTIEERAARLLRGEVAVLLSGGRDSVCLLDLAVRLAGPVTALHVNYGLRAEADDDEAFCRDLCARLRVPLTVHRAGAPEGNVQAWARGVRYAAAERLAGLIATGHTATDQVETVLYRLAASPGRRALLGMEACSGRVIRPLLEVTREETAAYCRARGLAWREDASNDSPAYARSRVRNELLPVLRSLHPAAEANVLRTLAVLRDEAAVLDELVPVEPDLDRLAALPAALARLAVTEMAGAPIGGRLPEILALSRSGTATLDLGGGLRAVAEYGRLRFDHGPLPPPEPAVLPVPGSIAYGDGRLTCEEAADGGFDADALGVRLAVRPWQAGDRMRLRGGSRTLQDLFTDRKIPRERRARTPVVLSEGEIAWVPGVATGERFRVGDRTRRRARLAWLPPSRPSI
jgi:tRNA(Ile)-lysidine synthase